MLAEADAILFYLQPGTLSPISMLELGICLEAKRKMVVCCPSGFWRKGNIDFTCSDYGVPVIHDLERAVRRLKQIL